MATNLESKLRQFTGTQEYHAHWLKNIVYTDGVAYLAEKAKCYWLIDAIASHQPQALRDPMLKEIQFWILIVNSDNSAILSCDRDKDDTAIKQEIPLTDFPMPRIKLYLTNRVLMLASEY